MARPLQKKKNKSSLRRVRQKPKSKKLNLQSNPLVADNWDQSLTLRQNYKNLGLTSRLNSSTGGIEKKNAAEQTRHDGLKVPSSRKETQMQPGRVRVVRDEVTGAIRGVVREEGGRDRNPLRDPLNELSDGEDEHDLGEGGDGEGEMDSGRRKVLKSGGIVPELEESARYRVKKRPRQQSQREQEWAKKLVERYGEDYRGMVRDRKLNPMQQSEGDLKRRVEQWRKENGKDVREGEGVDAG